MLAFGDALGTWSPAPLQRGPEEGQREDIREMWGAQAREGKRTRERKAWRLEKSREAEKTEADIGEGEKRGEQRSKREIVESQREDRDRRSGSQDD